MPNYKWENPYEWLEHKQEEWSKEETAQALLSLALHTDSDTLQDLFQSDMEEDGYFLPADQYGHTVPNDLVLLPSGCLLQTELAEVVAATWYEVDGILMASAEQIGHLSEDDPEDAGIDLAEAKMIMQVQDCLKRWDIKGGNEPFLEYYFYHA